MDMSVWYLLGAVLVFFMQAGFAMVETGFTRAKNAGNIIMKNLMDFCIGTAVFVFLGFGIMNSENYFFGLIGKPEYQMFTDFATFDWKMFFFQLVFCATCATIVSGAMAERTKFSMYCLYSAIISAVVYPIEAGWVWNSQGWLAKLGYVDFAGSSVIHMVGGITALVGAAILGPRIGKFGKNGKPKAIPGHNITVGALGCFILWFAWYGFNGAAASTPESLAAILGTTTLAPAFATLSVMIVTWVKYGKPDVSMCLNGSLAGLVAVTAGCASVDTVGAIIIGIISGCLVVFGVWFVDNVLKVDDPVGAVAVHGCNGLFGTFAVGLFATGTPQYPDGLHGLFYGGGVKLLGIQCLGILTIGAYAAIVMALVFFVMDKIWGLRVSAEEEIEGLDSTEHGLPSAYADFMPAGNLFYSAGPSPISAKVTGDVPLEKAVSVTAVPELVKPSRAAKEDTAKDNANKLTKIAIVARQSQFEDLKSALNEMGVKGITVTQVLGCGVQKGSAEYYRGVPLEFNLLPKIKVEVVVSKVPVRDVINTAKKALYTGHIGDGKIFVYDVENVVKVRTGEEGYDALQDDA
ncbi:MAG: ammonium transporter [Lachnospiraceae bacterium]|nr:ammonium transporter [Lachnospiraceae bacterium]